MAVTDLREFVPRFLELRQLRPFELLERWRTIEVLHVIPTSHCYISDSASAWFVIDAQDYQGRHFQSRGRFSLTADEMIIGKLPSIFGQALEDAIRRLPEWTFFPDPED